MKAIVYTQYGGPEVLRLADIPKPSPADDEVLVKVYACSINDWDYGLFQGDTFVNRIMYGLTKPKRQILGSDIAGKVEAIGKNVRKFKIGDEVFGDLSGRWGGFAEYVCAPENTLGFKSPKMTFEEAAAIPQAGMLAVQGLIDVGQLKKGQKLLINGAGGGVGTFAIQIARCIGAEITVVDSKAKFEMLHSLGVAKVVDYRQTDFTNSGDTYDLILDARTDRSAFKYLNALTPTGTYVTVGGSTPRLLQSLLVGQLISRFSKKNLRIVVLRPNKDLQYMNDLFESGKMKPVIDGPFSLEDVPKAFEHFGRAEHKGKIVISVVAENK
jgi:NADPH:quinone reductase-like Zn-dependent oxidoreductase